MNLQIPRIISFDCADHDPIEEWVPSDPYDVEIWVNFQIGLDDSEVGDNFVAHVLTHKAISHAKDKKQISLVLPVYSFELLMTEMQSLLSKSSGSDWLEIQDKLRGKLHWEYEGMI